VFLPGLVRAIGHDITGLMVNKQAYCLGGTNDQDS